MIIFLSILRNAWFDDTIYPHEVVWHVLLRGLGLQTLSTTLTLLLGVI